MMATGLVYECISVLCIIIITNISICVLVLSVQVSVYVLLIKCFTLVMFVLVVVFGIIFVFVIGFVFVKIFIFRVAICGLFGCLWQMDPDKFLVIFICASCLLDLPIPLIFFMFVFAQISFFFHLVITLCMFSCYV